MLQREQKKEYIGALLQSVTKYDRNLTKYCGNMAKNYRIVTFSSLNITK